MKSRLDVNETVFAFYLAEGKCMNLTILSPAMGK